MITTGTVTRAFPILPGERWTTRLVGLDLPGMDVTFA
jgi:2-oxo-3-hexenedioate decarboxylase